MGFLSRYVNTSFISRNGPW